KDRTPYKTHCGAVVEPGRGSGAYYVEIGPDGLVVGGGCLHLAPDQLARFRRAVDTEVYGNALAAIVVGLRQAGRQVGGERLRYKSLYVTYTWPPDDTLHEPGSLDRVRGAWREVRAFNEWARDRVGPSDRPRGKPGR